jgi:RNA polymerase sigma-70 factor (ECF subfamily)
MSPTRSARPLAAEFERAVRDHHGAVYSAALRVTRDEALALDATQQTFLRVLEGKLDLSTAEDLQRWLRCAAAREALMVLRAASSRRRREEQHAMQRPESFDDQSTEKADTLRAVRRALTELPEELRTALTLRFQEELTFSEMGGVLAISEPSAHQRVQRGLEKLREKLARLGFAALAPQVEALLQREGAASGAPAGLEKNLLSLSKGATGVGALGVSVLVASLVVGASAWFWMSHSREADTHAALAAAPEAPTSSRSEAAPAPSDVEPERRSVDAQPASGAATQTPDTRRAAQLENGRIEGRVVDGFGLPLENVLVIAASVERDGKFAADSAEARTARDGSFALSVPVRLERGQDYRLSASTSHFHGNSNVLRVRPGAACEPQRIMLESEAAETGGAWRLELALRDSDGRPIDGAITQVHTIVRHASGSSWPQHQNGAVTERGGIVNLYGVGHGVKLITIDARKFGFAMFQERIEIAQDGLTRRALVLQRGLELTGAIVDHLGAPITRERLGSNTTSLFAKEPSSGSWLDAEFPEPGRFRIPALAAVPHELNFRHDSWSSFTLVVTPGASEVKLRLKLKQDTTDSGNHSAEIHGALVDAATGAPVENEIATTWLERVPNDSPALFDRDWAPLVMQAVVAQISAGFPSGEDLPPAPPANSFIYDGLEPGRYVVRVFADGYAPALVGPLELRAHEIAAGLTVRLTRGATVSGRVLDANGAPLAGARVHILGDGELSHASLAEADTELRSTGGRGFQYKPGVETDAEGRFTRSKVPTDRPLKLYVLHPDRELAHGAWLELSEGGAVQVELRAGAARER